MLPLLFVDDDQDGAALLIGVEFGTTLFLCTRRLGP